MVDQTLKITDEKRTQDTAFQQAQVHLTEEDEDWEKDEGLSTVDYDPSRKFTGFSGFE